MGFRKGWDFNWIKHMEPGTSGTADWDTSFSDTVMDRPLLPGRKQPRLEIATRIQAILVILEDGYSHKAGVIAYQLRISSRTVRRTLHYMRDEMGMPIQSTTAGFSLSAAPIPETTV
jgi:hypothetical protein